MCFRLLAAVDPPMDAEALKALAFRQGLDVRVGPSAQARFVEVAWGDCACSLYTGREGRERAVGLVEALLGQGLAVQLLLFSDGAELRWESSAPRAVAMEAFRAGGLQALPEGEVAEVRAAGQ
jgi:hypothetical protein